MVDEEEAVDRVGGARQRRHVERVASVRAHPALEGDDLVVGRRRARRDAHRQRPHAGGGTRRELRVPEEGSLVEAGTDQATGGGGGRARPWRRAGGTERFRGHVGPPAHDGVHVAVADVGGGAQRSVVQLVDAVHREVELGGNGGAEDQVRTWPADVEGLHESRRLTANVADTEGQEQR